MTNPIARLDPALLEKLAEQDVVPGNIYPAQGGRKSPGTEYWLVVALTKTGAVCIGFDKDGNACSSGTYYQHSMRSRPIIGRGDIGNIKLKVDECPRCHTDQP